MDAEQNVIEWGTEIDDGVGMIKRNIFEVSMCCDNSTLRVLMFILFNTPVVDKTVVLKKDNIMEQCNIKSETTYYSSMKFLIKMGVITPSTEKSIFWLSSNVIL